MLVTHISRTWLEFELSQEEFKQLLGITSVTGHIVQVSVIGDRITVTAKDESASTTTDCHAGASNMNCIRRAVIRLCVLLTDSGYSSLDGIRKETTMIDLHDADNHAPFAHYMITIPATAMNVHDRHTRKIIILEKPATEYVVCYFCEHWVQRALAKCECPASCHVEALAYRK